MNSFKNFLFLLDKIQKSGFLNLLYEIDKSG